MADQSIEAKLLALTEARKRSAQWLADADGNEFENHLRDAYSRMLRESKDSVGSYTKHDLASPNAGKGRLGLPWTVKHPNENVDSLAEKAFGRGFPDASLAESAEGLEEDSRKIIKQKKYLKPGYAKLVHNRIRSIGASDAARGRFPEWIRSMVQAGRMAPGAAAELFKDLLTSGRMNALGPIIPEGLINSMRQQALRNRAAITQRQMM